MPRGRYRSRRSRGCCGSPCQAASIPADTPPRRRASRPSSRQGTDQPPRSETRRGGTPHRRCRETRSTLAGVVELLVEVGVHQRLPARGVWAVPRVVRSGDVVGKDGLESRAEESAVSMRLWLSSRERQPRPDATRPAGAGGSSRCALSRPIRCCTCVNAPALCPVSSTFTDVRTANPLQQATVVEARASVFAGQPSCQGSGAGWCPEADRTCLPLQRLPPSQGCSPTPRRPPVARDLPAARTRGRTSARRW